MASAGTDAPGRPALRDPGRERVRRAVAIGTAAVALAAVGAGIGIAMRPPIVRGHVVDVVARDIGHAASVTIRDLDGVVHVLDVDPAVDMTPGHLREHMMFGEPVTVTLAPARDRGARAVAVRIVDGVE
jgi:hypothetical protein